MIRPFRPAPDGAARRLQALLFSRKARPVRFAITGGTAGLAQLTLLKLLTDHGWQALIANTVAFLLAAQLNFVLSSLFTWRDRRIRQSIGRRWVAFHGSIASMAVVNLLVFAAARLVLPDLAASAAGICAASIGNFFIGDRLVFRSQNGGTTRGRRGVARQPRAGVIIPLHIGAYKERPHGYKSY